MKTYEHLTLYLERDRLKLLNMRKDIQQKLKSLPELLTISQVAEIFSIHPDTLRNWEKDGTLVPLRVGKRGDRKYRPQDIETIIDKMGSKLTLPQLESFLWKSADILRGKIDSSDYKKYIFGLLFYKRMSDVWDEEYNNILETFKDDNSKVMLARADYNHRFQVPKDCRWNVITEQAENIGQKLNEIFEKLTNANSPKLDKIFDDLDFANKDRFPNETLQRLINHFSQYNFGDTYISSDLLGDAYEYLIKQFAADAGKKGGEFYTPREVEKIIMGIVKPHQKDHIYDPTVGSAGFLLEAYDYLKQKSGEKIARTLYLYGQEQNLATFAIARINMFLHGLDSADIRRGDTLANPQFLNQQGNLQTFDIVVANPPYSIKDWEYEAFKNRYGRIDGYEMPPDKNADYAFVLHIIKSMNQNGRAGVVLPHGVLFRGGAEARIREQILKNDLIETIISLPSNLFYKVNIPVVIIVFNKNKPSNKREKVLFISAEKDYLENKNQDVLRPQDINKIIKAYDNYGDIDGYSRIVNMDEILNHKYDLKINNYINNAEKEKDIDTRLILNELYLFENKYKEIDRNLKISKIFDKKTGDIKFKKTKLGLILEDWDLKKIKDVALFENGKAHEGEICSSGKYIVVNSKFISSDGEIKKYTNNGLKILKKGDIAIVMSDLPNGKALGKCFLVDQDDKYTLNQRIGLIRPIDGISEYFYHYLNRNKYFLSFDNGVSQTNLKKEDILDCPIIIPSKDEQKDINKILNLIDKKLEINRELKEKLTQLKKGLMSDLLSGKVRV